MSSFVLVCVFWHCLMSVASFYTSSTYSSKSTAVCVAKEWECLNQRNTHACRALTGGGKRGCYTCSEHVYPSRLLSAHMLLALLNNFSQKMNTRIASTGGGKRGCYTRNEHVYPSRLLNAMTQQQQQQQTQVRDAGQGRGLEEECKCVCSCVCVLEEASLYTHTLTDC